MDRYQLVGVDQMEATKLRRKLDDPWCVSKSERVRPLIEEVATRCELHLAIAEPRWEFGVYPLYYLYAGNSHGNTGALYSRIVNDYKTLFSGLDRKCAEEQLFPLIKHVANTEVDLLIEDKEYFIFVEAKDPPEGRPAIFQKRNGVHQLVLQYAQGLFLAKKIRKRFCLATLGARINSYSLSPPDKNLLAIFGDNNETLKFCDLPW